MKKMGNMNDMLAMMPGMKGKLDDVQIDEKQLARTEAILLSMTPQERAKPEIINASAASGGSHAGCGHGGGRGQPSCCSQFEQTRETDDASWARWAKKASIRAAFSGLPGNMPF